MPWWPLPWSVAWNEDLHVIDLEVAKATMRPRYRWSVTWVRIPHDVQCYCCMKQPEMGSGRGFDSRLVHQKCCLGWYVGV